MGKYYGLINHTRNQKVSSYWKNDPWCDLYLVMHFLGWQPSDFITSASYDDIYNFIHDTENKTMKLVDSYFNENDNDQEMPKSEGELISLGVPDTINEKALNNTNHLPN